VVVVKKSGEEGEWLNWRLSGGEIMFNLLAGPVQLPPRCSFKFNSPFRLDWASRCACVRPQTSSQHCELVAIESSPHIKRVGPLCGPKLKSPAPS